MFIAVTDGHGWARAKTKEQALKEAMGHSFRNRKTLARVWECRDDAYVDGMGTVYGVLSEYEEYTQNKNGRKWFFVKKEEKND